MTHAAAAHPGREPLLDWLRGFAALAVVMFHYFHKGPKEGWMQAQQHPLLDALAAYGYLGVHLFFMISGYVIMMTAQNANLRRFLASRVSRLLPALWFCATLTAVIELLVPAAPFRPASWAQYLANLTLVPGWFGQEPIDGAYWSLTIEINFYLWVAAAIALGQLRHIERLLLAWLALSFVNFLRPMHPVQVLTSAHWAPLFAAGAFFFLVRQSGWTRQRCLALGVSLVLACGYAWRETGHISHWGMLFRLDSGPNHLAVQGIILSCFAVFLWMVSRPANQAGGYFSDLSGRLTYPLYLIHQNAGYALFGVAVSGGMVSVLGPGLVSLLILGLAVVVAWFVNVVVEQRLGPPLRRWVAGPAPGASGPLPSNIITRRERS